MRMELPDYDDLPVLERLGLRHAWDVWGRDDDLGTINLLTPEGVLAAKDTVATGEIVNLSLPMTEPEPPLFGRRPLQHSIFHLDRNTLDDRVDQLYPQASSQWDSLRHVRAREHGYYTGITEDFTPGAGRLGIEHWVKHGLVGCGVLLDVAGFMAARDGGWDALRPVGIDADLLQNIAAHQGVTIRSGDMLCLHFGWVEAYRALSTNQRGAYADEIAHAGLAGSEDMARLLWNWHVSALIADNPAVEVVPGDPQVGSLHRRILPLMGFALAEMLDFSDLAPKLRQAGRWRFMFTAVPLHLPGAISSPANAIAIL